MPNTLPNIPLPKGEWVDLYVASGIAVGTQIRSRNLGGAEAHLYTAPDSPTGDYGFEPLLPNEAAANDTGDTGAWAICPEDNGLLNIKVVV